MDFPSLKLYVQDSNEGGKYKERNIFVTYPTTFLKLPNVARAIVHASLEKLNTKKEILKAGKVVYKDFKEKRPVNANEP